MTRNMADNSYGWRPGGLPYYLPYVRLHVIDNRGGQYLYVYGFYVNYIGVSLSSRRASGFVEVV